MNVLALCAGAGGLELGIKLANPSARCVCYVEGEGYAASILVQRMEEKCLDQAPLWSDVRSFDGGPWRGTVDCISGGFPCQPFSLAGKRKGDEDPRHLWPSFQRIIGEVRPPICFFENVPGLLSLGFEAVANDLEAMGYRVAAGLFTAEEVGASHKRERLFIMAHTQRSERRASDEGCGCTEQGENGKRKEASSAGTVGPDVADSFSLDRPRRGTARNVATSEGNLENNRQKRERCWDALDDRVNYHYSTSRSKHDQLEHSKGFGRGEGRSEHEFWGRGRSAPGSGGSVLGTTVADSDCERLDGTWPRGSEADFPRRFIDEGIPKWPPFQSDIPAWRYVFERTTLLEPAVRRVAHGMAHRVDRLRACGNGVVPLVAAHAWRTLEAAF
jgi:DNA (cytosine-5)-methyltransferase 1